MIKYVNWHSKLLSYGVGNLKVPRIEMLKVETESHRISQSMKAFKIENKNSLLEVLKLSNYKM